jgi:hypothetical protein
MGRDYSASERLRYLARAYFRKDGASYDVGNGRRLAEFIGIDAGWVSAYVADTPTRHAGFDQGLAICMFLNINPLDLATHMPKMTGPPIDPELAAALQDQTKREQVRTFLALPDWERETILHAATLRRRRESSPESTAADQAAGGEKPRKRGRAGSRAGGKR